jgi:hypothetical protein
VFDMAEQELINQGRNYAYACGEASVIITNLALNLAELKRPQDNFKIKMAVEWIKRNGQDYQKKQLINL